MRLQRLLFTLDDWKRCAGLCTSFSSSLEEGSGGVSRPCRRGRSICKSSSEGLLSPDPLFLLFQALGPLAEIPL